MYCKEDPHIPEFYRALTEATAKLKFRGEEKKGLSAKAVAVVNKKLAWIKVEDAESNKENVVEKPRGNSADRDLALILSGNTVYWICELFVLTGTRRAGNLIELYIIWGGCQDLFGSPKVSPGAAKEGGLLNRIILLESLIPKWDPRKATPEAPAPEIEDTEELATFVGSTRIRSLADGFRIFTKDKAIPDIPEVVQGYPMVPVVAGVTTAFVIAGAVESGGTADAKAGVGILLQRAPELGSAIRIPKDLPQSVQSAEILGALLSVKQTPTEAPLRIVSRKNNILRSMTKKLPAWEDKGWIETPNAEGLQALAAALRGRTAETKLAVVTSSIEVEEAHRLARTGTGKQDTDQIDLRIADHLQLRGAKLSTLTQGSAYRGIKALKERVHRKATDANVLNTQSAVKALFKKAPTEKLIWRSIRNKDISRQIRNFMWKTLHGAHRIGKFWEHIPEMGDRATCQHCGVTESMEHILTECDRPGRAEIWALAEALWLKKYTTWPAVSFGGLMGGALAAFQGDNGKESPSTARLYRILMTESIWVALMNERLEIDRNLTNHMRFGKQHALPPSLVLETWKGTLFNEDKMPPQWLREPEVLGDEAEIDNGGKSPTVADCFGSGPLHLRQSGGG
ncbi:hypothetical protein B0H16DRAFT_1460552 [Mycena metata]|uniref:Reverse transcriptase zinc-binding domain-containing protein n=1 Tax=Mycena metata TaxID=1033252 RepID=A0AAD7IUM2_9AGAR|nr:hypothetical protein B0H16DRAFT_1460552 [Mycena metata]